VTFDWSEGPEPVAFQVTGVCSLHAHFELLGVDGSAVAGGILSRQECVTLANLFVKTIDLIDDTESHERKYIDHGIRELENLQGV
jgi:hypothetical protein